MTSPTGATGATRAVLLDPEKLKDEVHQIFAAFRDHEDVPGLAYGITTTDGLLLSGAVGIADVETSEPVSDKTVWRIASMTKSVTALCVCLLRDDGRFSLDDPVGRFVPELARVPLPTTDSAPLTIRQLLTMASGLVQDDPWADRQLAMPEDTFTAFLAAGFAFDAPPGTNFEYSNLGYAILGRLVSNVAGQPLAEFAAQRLFAPLGMLDTTWSVGDGLPRAAQGYRVRDGAWERETLLGHGAFGAMGGLATTVEDFSRYVAFHLSAWPPRNEPEAGPARRSTLREMCQGWRSGSAFYARHGIHVHGEGYGYGLVTAMHDRDGRMVAHSGGLPGFGSFVEWLPEHGIGVVAFANRTYAPIRRAVREVFDTLATQTGRQPARPAPSPALFAAQQWLTRLFDEWDDGHADSMAADNLFMDLPRDARRAELETLRHAHGPCLEVGALLAEGALRGRWEMHCGSGVLQAEVLLAPTPQPLVQSYTIAPVKPHVA